MLNLAILKAFADDKNVSNDGPSPIAQSVALQTREQEVAGSIPGSANILSED